jgi:hypothetical protein
VDLVEEAAEVPSAAAEVSEDEAEAPSEAAVEVLSEASVDHLEVTEADSVVMEVD